MPRKISTVDNDSKGGPDAKLLKEIRDRFKYASDSWSEAREERRIDMRFIAGDAWDEKDRKARKDAGRPCINHDELSQYVNACVNTARENKRSIKIEPGGAGADTKSAELRQNLIRGAEYKSHAPSIYLSAFQAMVEGSYGFFRIGRRYVSDDSFDQEIVVKNIDNPDSVLYDPDVKEPDWSDGEYCFVLDPVRRDDFKQRYPDATVTDFSLEDMRVAKDWIQDKIILTAEYWKIEKTRSKLYLFENGESATTLPAGVKPARTRTVEKKALVQYITNGVEILETNPQPGELLAIIPMVGLQRYIDDGGGAKRKLFSLVRLARDPQMSLAYLNSQEMEEAGLSPKVPFIGYKGQFESDAVAWASVTKIPHGFLQADPITDGSNGQVLPLPQRQQYVPNFMAFEAAKDSCRRAIQAAMGISPLPTAAQRDNAKSGVALQRIQQQQQIGSFHFTDGFDRALEFAGRVINSWIPVVYDTERAVAIRKPDDSHQIVQLNTAAPYAEQAGGDPEHYPIDDADHDVTVSTGPSTQSQWEAQSDFLDQLIANLHGLPVPPPQQAKLLAMAIRMKNLGAKGDEMADIISPPENQPMSPAAQAALQHASALVQQLSQTVHSLLDEKQAKLSELASKERIAALNNKAGMIEALIKAQSTEAIAAFNADIEQIDRMLAMIPDPALAASPGAPPSAPSGANAAATNPPASSPPLGGGVPQAGPPLAA
jgi:hypothetical protein